MKLVADWRGYPEANFQILQSSRGKGVLHVLNQENGRPACNVNGDFAPQGFKRHSDLGRLVGKSPSPVCIRCWKLARNAQVNEKI